MIDYKFLDISIVIETTNNRWNHREEVRDESRS